MFVWDQGVGEPLPLVYTGGAEADASPVGGVYAGARSAPAADAAGGLVFVVRIAGGATSEALVFRPAGGAATPIVVGDAAPGVATWTPRGWIVSSNGTVLVKAPATGGTLVPFTNLDSAQGEGREDLPVAAERVAVDGERGATVILDGPRERRHTRGRVGAREASRVEAAGRGSCFGFLFLRSRHALLPSVRDFEQFNYKNYARLLLAGTGCCRV